MSDPIRLVDDPGSPIGRDLLLARARERPSEGARERAVVAATAAISVSVVPTVAAAAKGATKVVVGKWLALGAAGVIASASAVAVVVDRTAPVEDVRPPVVFVQPRVAPSPRAVTTEAPTEEPPAPSVRHATRPRATASAEPSATEAPPPPGDAVRASIASELAEIDQAREAVRTDPERALVLLDAFDQRHPGSVLADEAAVARVEALLAAGRRAEAGEQAAAFVTKRPTSHYAPRMRRIAGASKESKP